MKGKVKIVLFFFSLAFVLLLIDKMFSESSTEFSNYAEVFIDNDICLVDTNSFKSRTCSFKLKNLSGNPFLITDIKGKEKFDFGLTRIRKLVPKDSTTEIKVSFKSDYKLIAKDSIELICNAKSGNILLYIEPL